MRIEQLRYLLEISKVQSVSKVAEQNYISHQALSKSMKALEKEFGQKLLFSSHKKTLLTPVGELVCTYAVPIVQQADELLKKVQALSYSDANQSYSIKILSFTALSNLFIDDLLLFFNRLNPNIDITVQNTSSYTISSAVESIKAFSGDLIFISINDNYWEYFYDQISSEIHSYIILLDDQITVVTSNGLSLSDSDIIDLLAIHSNKALQPAVFSHIPNEKLMNQKMFNVSSDVEFVKSMLKNSNLLVTMPLYLASKYFNTTKYKFYSLPQRQRLMHICLYKTPPTSEIKQYIINLKHFF